MNPDKIKNGLPDLTDEEFYEFYGMIEGEEEEEKSEVEIVFELSEYYQD